jgi:D-methionine transport system ATP-binding protein
MDVVKQICNKVAVLENGRLVEELSLTHAKGAPASNFGRLLFQPKNEWLLAREVASV